MNNLNDSKRENDNYALEESESYNELMQARYGMEGDLGHKPEMTHDDYSSRLVQIKMEIINKSREPSSN